jgi:RHS repeat-associated protein
MQRSKSRDKLSLFVLRWEATLAVTAKPRAFITTHRYDAKITALRTHHNYTYQAFGTLDRAIGGTNNQYLFAGEQFDKKLAQYYLRQRSYDPYVGRFNQRDLFEGELEIPQTQHKYTYAFANPTIFVDPSGLLPAWLEGVFVHNELYKDFLNSSQSILSTHERLANRAISTVLVYRAQLTGQSYSTPSYSYALTRPDLIDLTDQDLYEIKTRRGASTGATELTWYINKLNRHDLGWSEGTLYIPPATMQIPTVGWIEVDPPTTEGSGYPGVVTYQKIGGDRSNSHSSVSDIVIVVEMILIILATLQAVRSPI